jgi:hypothetical protein
MKFSGEGLQVFRSRTQRFSAAVDLARAFDVVSSMDADAVFVARRLVAWCAHFEALCPGPGAEITERALDEVAPLHESYRILRDRFRVTP